MEYIFPWRKAITVSIFLHIFLLVTAGYLTVGLTASVPADEKIILEMDLINESGINSNLPQSPAQQDPSSTVPEPKQIQSVSSDTTAAETAPSVTTNDLSIIEADTPAPSAASSQREANRSAAVSTSAATALSSDKMSGGNAGSGITPPGILAKVDPVYPAIARQAGQQGTVLLKIEILVNGRPGRITIARSTNYPALDEAAMAAVRQWQFVPTKDLSSGQAIVCTTTLPVSFRLNK